MRFRLILGGVALLVILSIVLAVVFLRTIQYSNNHHPTSLKSAWDTLPAKTFSPVIIDENAFPGTSDWAIPSDKESTTQIQAYASATSVTPGDKLTFYVSTLEEGTAYSINIYRIGWYSGMGGRLMKSISNQIGHAQGYYNIDKNQLVNCASCSVNKNTGLVEANWQPSSTITIPSDWVTGVYLAKFIDINGMQTYAPFDVRGHTTSLYIAVTSDTTYAAYNIWGGYSLYEGDSQEGGKLAMGVKVSFDRPYVDGDGSGYVLRFEVDTIRWLEREGYDVSYISSVDLHEHPEQLLQHRAYLSLGHDEYWTKEMRDGVETARDAGVGLAFLGANASYWQMRFEPDSKGIVNRTIVCYKVQTSNSDLKRDPFYNKDNTRVTSQWRDPVLNRPENALIGIMYSDLTHKQEGFPWQSTERATSRLLIGTDLKLNQQYGCGLVGYEWDHVFDNGFTPRGLQVIGRSPTKTQDNVADISNTTYYISSSGAFVFATGSLYWTYALDSYRPNTDPVCVNHTLVVPEMQRLMARVMLALVVHFRIGD